MFRKEIVSRKNLRNCQFEHNLQDVPKMISSSAFSFGVLEALPLNILFNIFSIITLKDKIKVIRRRKWLIEARTNFGTP